MPKRGSRAFAVLERRKAVAQRYLRGLSTWEIARELEVSQKTISNDVIFLQAEWRERLREDIDARNASDLAKIAEVERQAWDAWSTSRVNDRPDPRYLAVIMQCLERRSKILNGDDSRGKLTDAERVTLENILLERLGLINLGGNPPPRVGYAAPVPNGSNGHIPEGGNGAGPVAGESPPPLF